MSSPGSGVARCARTAVLAAVMMALALGSHTLAGGHAPESWVIAPAGTLAIITSYLLTRVRTGFGTIFALLTLAQTGFHAFAEWCPPWCMTAAHHMSEHSDGPSMTAAHLAAAFVTAGIVAYGDRVLWTLWHWLTRHLRTIPQTPSIVETSYAPVVFTRTVPPAQPATGALSRRGPPLIPAFMS